MSGVCTVISNSRWSVSSHASSCKVTGLQWREEALQAQKSIWDLLSPAQALRVHTPPSPACTCLL
eukprot:12639516-Prorocentrum_lima.AAC.1